MIPNKPDQKLRELALDVVAGRVFSSTGLSAEEIQHHFYPVLFGAFDEVVKYAKDNPEADNAIGLVFEDVSQALPRALNGKPIFMSCDALNRADTKRLMHYVKVLQAQEEKFVNEPTT